MESRANKKWTEEERMLLEAKWGLWSYDRLSKELNRSKESIERQAYRLGLGSCYRSAYFTPNQIGEMFGVDGTTVNRYWINKYGLKASRSALIERRLYRINFDNLIKWLEHNQDKWKSNRLEIGALGVEYDWLKEKRKKDSGAVKDKHKTFWTTKEHNRFLEMIAQGKTSKEIAKELNRTTRAIMSRRNYLRALKKKEEQIS